MLQKNGGIMFRIVFITSMFDNMYTLNKVCNSIIKEYPEKFEFKFFTAFEIDSVMKYIINWKILLKKVI